MLSSQNLSEEKFYQTIANFLITACQPFSNSFQLLIRSLRSDVPSADTMTQFIRRNFYTLREQIKSKLSKVDSKISLSLDCWTSNVNMSWTSNANMSWTSDVNMKAFVGITAHWIDEDWCMRECLLDFVDTNETLHCGANVSKSVAGVIKDFELDGKILAIVTDTTACHKILTENMQYFGISVTHVRSFTHIPNRSIQDAIKCTADSTSLLRELIKKIEYSPSMLALGVFQVWGNGKHRRMENGIRKYLE
ncbi:hypothetical protein BC937DRAFT_87969 [Endogone sp. FLAS-F59071]|nr:hypothetical protein BC937DRAFT_87969 [Endogone sp. FLAS-F59071]|eukprot:RUS19123.1 hypothetical protein BC937DRAFT_87969 [Endogone sp. FLAS-F59071]